MNTLKKFNQQCITAYTELLKKEEHYEAWSSASVITVNGQLQEKFPLLSLTATKRFDPFHLKMSVAEELQYHEKVASFLELEASLHRMNTYGSWVSCCQRFSYPELQELLDLEAIQKDPQAYLDKYLKRFPHDIQDIVKEVINSLRQWKTIMEYL